MYRCRIDQELEKFAAIQRAQKKKRKKQTNKKKIHGFDH